MSKFSINYVEDEGINPYTIHMEIDEEANLRQAFSVFVRLTKMVGYSSRSWDDIIKEVYQYCILHDEASEDYDIYAYAEDSVTEYLF